MDLNEINQIDPQEATSYVVEEYYKDNLEPFMAVLHPEIFFVSVGSGQVVEGIENLDAAYKEGMNHRLEGVTSYEILSLRCKKQRVTRDVCNILLQMEVISTFPSGEVIPVNQRISVNWKRFRKLEFSPDDIRTGWFAMQIHVSIGVEPVSPVSSIHHLAPSMAKETVYRSMNDDRYEIRDCDRFEHYVRMQEILRVQAKDMHSYVYMQNGEVIVTRRGLQEFEKDLSEKGFIRIHKSHIVNRSFVVGVKNYRLTMQDGMVFPVPRGKYKEVKMQLKTSK